MKILELNFEKTWRGGERQTLFCMHGFREHGDHVGVLCRNGYPMQERALADGFRVHAFNNIFRVIFFLLNARNKYDIFHAETAQILTYCILTQPFHRTKVTYTRRVDFVPKGFFTLWKYRLTDKVIVISHAIKKIIEDFTGRETVLISEIIIPNKLDKARAENILQEHNIPANKKIVATLAAFVPHKDPLTMVKAIKLLQEKRDDFVFLHFGEGELEEMIRAKVEEYQLGDTYKFMGFKNGAEDLYSVFDVYVMSSDQEGLGSSVLDAFIYKVPVVATVAGGMGELVKEDRGIACGIKKPKDIAAGIDKVLSDELVRSRITNNAYNYAIEYHNIKYLTEKHISLFKEMLD